MFYLTPVETMLKCLSALDAQTKPLECLNNFKVKNADDKVIVAVTLPGVKKEDIKIGINANKNGGRVLSVKYTEHDVFDPEKTTDGSSEISLPECEYSETSASYENGLLLVTLKKAAASSSEIQIA